MTELNSFAELLLTGLSRHGIRSATQTGEIERVVRGMYGAPLADDEPWAVRIAEHLRRVHACAKTGGPGRVVSHTSAALVHELGMLSPDLDLPHFTVSRRAGGHRTVAHLHPRTLRPEDIVEVGGLTVTSVARTAVDVARMKSFDSAVVVLDSALRAGAQLSELTRVVRSSKGQFGIATVREAIQHADGASESVGESWSRAQMIRAGLPLPTLQVRIDLPGGRKAFTDFGWYRQGRLVAVGEFDGVSKYVRYLRPGETSADAVMREKNRENDIRADGVLFARWDWSDLAAGLLLAKLEPILPEIRAA